MITNNPELQVYRIVVKPLQSEDPRSAGLLSDARALGLEGVSRLICHDLYFIEGQVSEPGLARIAGELLSDPITQTAEWGRLFENWVSLPGGVSLLEVALRPGITDPVAEQIIRAASVIGVGGVQRVCTGQRYLITGEDITADDLHRLAKRLLANPVIQRYTLDEIEPVFLEFSGSLQQVEQVPLRSLDEAGLLVLSADRRAALDLAEMQAVQVYFQSEGREPTDVEFEMIAQTWSEHCVHKTFRAYIRMEDGSPPVNNLLKTYLKSATDEIAAPWVLSAFVDNAGIIDFDEEHEISFKVETHNHPSAIEPFGGANTGIGGVIRDVIGVSAKPIAATNILCFGPEDAKFNQIPEGVLHPRVVRSGVVAGIQDYGNKIGIPTVNGAVYYDPGFTANPLVYCGCVGISPKQPHDRLPQPGDHVIVLGGRTGRDGLRGATFSSMTMDAQTGEVAGASVQIGDPITEKGLIEVIVRTRDAGLYTAITDCGAGGLSSAVGEMAKTCGVDVELADVPLKYQGLHPWEIWLSEAQERMVLSVPPGHKPALQEICDLFDVEMTDLGHFTATNRVVVRYRGAVVLDLLNDFLHDGIPQRQLLARIPSAKPSTGAGNVIREEQNISYSDRLLQLLSHPDIATKADIIRIYDHEVQGGTVLKPLVGVFNDGPSDACVLKPFGTRGDKGLVLSNGINPQYGKVDAYRMAWCAVDEAVRNAVAVGADPDRIAILDNFCWGDPLNPDTLGSLVEAARGCHDAALAYRTPFISGKDSLNNEYIGIDGFRHAIPASLLISAMGILPDIHKTVTMYAKHPGDNIYLLGNFSPAFGGSHYGLVSGRSEELTGDGLPPLSTSSPLVYRAFFQAVQRGLVQAAHDLSEGGLAVAAAEMCLAGRKGMQLTLPAGETLRSLFGQTNGTFLVEVKPEDSAEFESLVAELPCLLLGRVSQEAGLDINEGGSPVIHLPVAEILSAWNKSIRGGTL